MRWSYPRFCHRPSASSSIPWYQDSGVFSRSAYWDAEESSRLLSKGGLGSLKGLIPMMSVRKVILSARG